MDKENSYQNPVMRMRDLTKYLPFSRAYIYQKISEGSFNPGYLISPGVRIWRKNDVDEWLNGKIKGAL
jgi:predicted DNA-binding transcriptional regulator AlpA